MGLKEKACESTGKLLKSCVENNGNFLFGSSAIGWVLASASQTVGLIQNKDIGKEEKKFLVPQEILDGIFNIATYAAVTLCMMKGAQGLAKKSFPSSERAVDGAKTLAAIAGGIVSSNIITPILRNKSSNIVKNAMDKKNLEKPSLDIYDGKTFPNFQGKAPFSMQSYMQYAKTKPYSGSLRI